MSEMNSEVKQSSMEVFFNGLVKENPTFVLTLGMCPTLAVTTSAINGLGMGLTTTAVLVLSNAIISLLRHIIPNRVRIPAFIVIVASFVTMVELLLEGFIPSLYTALGLYIPLIVVNCIILGRAAGELFGIPVINNVLGAVSSMLGRQEPVEYVPISIFVLAPGAFFVLAALTALQNRVKRKMQERGQNADKIQSGCSSDCAGCSDSGCARRFVDVDGTPGSVADAKKE